MFNGKICFLQSFSDSQMLLRTLFTTLSGGWSATVNDL